MTKLWLKRGRARPALAAAGLREGWQGRQRLPLGTGSFSLLGSNSKEGFWPEEGSEQEGCLQCYGEEAKGTMQKQDTLMQQKGCRGTLGGTGGPSAVLCLWLELPGRGEPRGASGSKSLQARRVCASAVFDSSKKYRRAQAAGRGEGAPEPPPGPLGEADPEHLFQFLPTLLDLEGTRAVKQGERAAPGTSPLPPQLAAAPRQHGTEPTLAKMCLPTASCAQGCW